MKSFAPRFVGRIRPACSTYAAMLIGAVLALGANSAAIADPQPTAAQAQQFVREAEEQLKALQLKARRAAWVQLNFITDDTELIAAEAQKEYTAAATEFAIKARSYDGLKLPYDTTRKLALLQRALNTPAPRNAPERDELTRIEVSLQSDYGKGKYCPDGDAKPCLTLNDMEKILAES